MGNVEIIRRRPLTLQVCAIKRLSNDEISTLTTALEPSGTSAGWVVVDKDDPCLDGAPLRVPCKDDSNRIHTILKC